MLGARVDAKEKSTRLGDVGAILTRRIFPYDRTPGKSDHTLRNTQELRTEKDNRGQFCFSLKAGSGKTILSSESYPAKASVLTGIDSVRANGPGKGQYEGRTYPRIIEGAKWRGDRTE